MCKRQERLVEVSMFSGGHSKLSGHMDVHFRALVLPTREVYEKRSDLGGERGVNEYTARKILSYTA